MKRYRNGTRIEIVAECAYVSDTFKKGHKATIVPSKKGRLTDKVGSWVHFDNDWKDRRFLMYEEFKVIYVWSLIKDRKMIMKKIIESMSIGHYSCPECGPFDVIHSSWDEINNNCSFCNSKVTILDRDLYKKVKGKWTKDNNLLKKNY